MVPNDWSIVQTIAQQGGIFAALMLVLWFYRRDWQQLTEFWQASTERQIEVISDNAAAIRDNTAATREIKQAVDMIQQNLSRRV